MAGGLTVAKFDWKTKEQLALELQEKTTELEELKKNQETMQKALDELILGGML
jgi:hypothetical protein